MNLSNAQRELIYLGLQQLDQTDEVVKLKEQFRKNRGTCDFNLIQEKLGIIHGLILEKVKGGYNVRDERNDVVVFIQEEDFHPEFGIDAYAVADELHELYCWHRDSRAGK